MRLSRKRVVIAAALAAACAPASASAAPALDGTFTPSGQPGQITPGPDGNVWFALSGSPANKEYAKIAPDGTITEFDTPTNGLALVDVTSGPNNHLWFSYNGGVLEVDPATGAGTQHPVATLAGPRGITTGPDGNVWVVAIDRLVKVAPSGAVLDGNVHNGLIAGRGITVGSDGRLWVADFGNGAITAVSPTAPAYTRQSFAVGGGPQEVAPGPAGQLSYTNPADQVGRITTAGAFTPTAVPGTDSFGVTFAADGAYWYAQFASNTVGRMTENGDYTQPVSLPAGSGPRYIATGANNTLWISAETSKKIHRITGVEPPPAQQPQTPEPEPTPQPVVDAAAPVVSAIRVNGKTRRLALTLDEPAALNLVVQQKRRSRARRSVWVGVRTVKLQGVAGANKVALGRKLKKGSYRVRITATDAAGNAARKTVAFKLAK